MVGNAQCESVKDKPMKDNKMRDKNAILVVVVLLAGALLVDKFKVYATNRGCIHKMKNCVIHFSVKV